MIHSQLAGADGNIWAHFIARGSEKMRKKNLHLLNPDEDLNFNLPIGNTKSSISPTLGFRLTPSNLFNKGLKFFP